MVGERGILGGVVHMTHCAFPGCDNPSSLKAAKGLCNSHYWQMHKGRELTPLSYRRNRCLPWLEEHVAHESDECLIWPYQRMKDSGAAAIKHKGRPRPAARVMCEMVHGSPPTPKHEAAHSCGKGHLGCVNPRHLRWATPKENSADKLLHGTHLCGEKLAWSKLTAATVVQLRSMVGTMSKRALARHFGVTPNTISKAIDGRTWRHV